MLPGRHRMSSEQQMQSRYQLFLLKRKVGNWPRMPSESKSQSENLHFLFRSLFFQMTWRLTLPASYYSHTMVWKWGATMPKTTKIAISLSENTKIMSFAICLNLICYGFTGKVSLVGELACYCLLFMKSDLTDCNIFWSQSENTSGETDW